MADLEHVRTFVAVYRTLSLTRAAAVLHRSQPTVSAHIKSLEAEAGRRLFVRLARGVAPTPHGHALARELLPHLDAIESTLEDLGPRRPLEGVTYLGGPADLMSLKVIPALTPLVEQGLRVSARLGIAEPLLQQLANGDLDLVVATRRSTRRDLEFEPLFDEDFVLVGSPAWAQDLPADVIAARGAAALEGVRVVAFDEELPLMRGYFAQVFGQAPGGTTTIVIGDLRGICEAVVAGAGISVLPRYVVAGALARGALVELHRVPKPPTNTIYLARRPGALEPRSSAVATTLRRAARDWALH